MSAPEMILVETHGPVGLIRGDSDLESEGLLRAFLLWQFDIVMYCNHYDK